MSGLNDLAITSEAAERCARACTDFAQEMASVRLDLQTVDFSSGFGTLPSGIALASKYSELTIGGPGSLAAMLEAHITVATNLATTFTEIGRNYEATDDAVAQSITITDPPR